jgi:hypothetical protein
VPVSVSATAVADELPREEMPAVERTNRLEVPWPGSSPPLCDLCAMPFSFSRVSRIDALVFTACLSGTQPPNPGLNTVLLSRSETQDSMTELNSVLPTDHIQALYRLLLIRTGQQLQAENALRKTLTESLQNSDSHQNRTDFVKFYQTALKIPGTAFDPSETDLTGWPLALHQLAEPERSAITLFYLEVLSPHVLSEILGLDIGELARIIGAARKTLENQGK